MGWLVVYLLPTVEEVAGPIKNLIMLPSHCVTGQLVLDGSSLPTLYTAHHVSLNHKIGNIQDTGLKQ
jgi:hypothetical protein